MRLNSLRFKINVLFSSTLFVLMVISGILLVFSIKNIIYRDMDRNLKAKAIQVEAILDAYAEIKETESHSAAIFQSLIYDPKVTSTEMDMINKLWHADVKALNIQYDYFRVVTASGRPILVSEKFPEELYEIFDDAMDGSLSSSEIPANIYYRGKKYRFINYPFALSGKIPLSLQIVTPMERADVILKKFLLSVVCVIGFITLMTMIFSSVLADKILKPILRLIKVTNRVTHKDLSVRIEDAGEYKEIKQLIKSFNVMIERLKASFDHINEFSSHVAHELKTPLAIMKGELELNLQSHDMNDENRAVLETILGEVDKLGVIIKDMLLLAKLDYDKGVFNFQNTDINGFLKGIYEQCLILTNAKEIDLKLELPDAKIEALVDEKHLRRLFLNLINNAVKYTPRQGRIIIDAKLVDRVLKVDVQDTGEGISRGDLSKIFDKFYRIRKGGEMNVGLGLNIALSIARAHRGDITVQSTPGKGSTFTVTLPVL